MLSTEITRLQLGRLLALLLMCLVAMLAQLGLATEHEAEPNPDDDLVIEISRGVIRPINLAVANINGGGTNLGQQINDIVANNFALSGHIEVLAPGEMPNQPFREEQIIYSSWERTGVEYLIFGEIVTRVGANPALRISVIDVSSKNLLGYKEFNFNPRFIRDFGHYVSDYIYETVTGLRGSFSTKIAYVKRRFLGEGQGFEFNLVIADADGQRERTILTSPRPISGITWSPDAKKLAYVSNENGRSNIFVQDIISGDRTLLTAYKGLNSSPAWSPDGRTIAVVLSQEANTDIYLLDLAAIGGSQAGRHLRLTQHPGIDTEPSWSSSGDRIIFTSDRVNRVPQIYEYNLQARSVRQLIRTSGSSGSPQYTHNDREVILADARSGGIVMYNIAAGRITSVISNTAPSLVDSPSVSPDGNRVVYTAKVAGRDRLAIASVDLGNSVYLNSGEVDIKSVAWSPYIFNVNF